MSEIDTRVASEKTTSVKFADDGSGNNAVRVVKNGSSIHLEDEGGCHESRTRASDVPNLILALQKAVELGWTK